MSQVGLSYKETADALTSFLEIVIHTILCIRSIYPPHTFTRRKAHSVPVYQSRHPQVRQYIAEVCSLIGKELERGNARRVTVVVKDLKGIPLERFIIDFGYLGMGLIDGKKDVPLTGAPTSDELSLLLRAFLIRLNALDSQLLDNTVETTFAIVVETSDDLEPSSNQGTDETPPWIPATKTDVLHPSNETHEPLLHVKAVETGVIDVRLMVQECMGKTGVEKLDIGI
ncbi:mitotic spindle assembly checkpoint protein MAD2B [Tremella mesenterica]|uniref:Mitotic spindle assembly checkpoint protein MAD2B n=1 Tax=Tremella mesenterica TaxID=5217 RepID=A0A4Q1BU82_TREME|nr:mitotic spindle assembly checkpoint protein MAD2B [Tremella mesenterica]